MAFLPMGNSNHVVVSVSIDFPTNSQRDAPFHRIAYDYSRADWDGLHNHLKDATWEDICVSAAASESCESAQVGIDIYIPHLIKQNCLLKTILRTLILMTQVSLYLFSLLELI